MPCVSATLTLSPMTRLLGKIACVLAVVLTLSGDVRFSFRRSTSIIDSVKFKYHQRPGHASLDLPEEVTHALDAINELPLIEPSAATENDPIVPKKFYIIPTPEVTDWLLGNHSVAALQYYERALNEDQAEIWIHRALVGHPSRTEDPLQADIFVIGGFLHWNYHLTRRPKHAKNFKLDPSIPEFNAKEFADQVVGRLVDPSKPHLLTIPTTNPGTSRKIGIKAMVKALTKGGVTDLWSLGFERNQWWQALPPERIIPVPYVARMALSKEDHDNLRTQPAERAGPPETNRTADFIFFAGDKRIHAKEWSGCDRSMVAPLAREANMDVRLSDQSNGAMANRHSIVSHFARLTQSEYNHRMHTSEFCLILCGDSPTSRSLTSAIVNGCIPLVVGSRLRGLCEPPCHQGWGWTVSGTDSPHLPFSSRINWSKFPEVDENEFSLNPASVLRDALAQIPDKRRNTMRNILRNHREGFIYGWGNPVKSAMFGQAVNYTWNAFLDSLGQGPPMMNASEIELELDLLVS